MLAILDVITLYDVKNYRSKLRDGAYL